MRNTLALALLLTGAVACGDGDAADVSGSYSLTLTNGPNECMSDGWMEGESSNAMVEVTQSGADTVAVVEGGAGAYLGVVVGTNRFQGRTSGNDMLLTAVGTTPYSIPGCEFTIDAILDAEVDGQFLMGEVAYRANTDGGAGCGTLATCENVQTAVGTRPPPGS